VTTENPSSYDNPGSFHKPDEFEKPASFENQGGSARMNENDEKLFDPLSAFVAGSVVGVVMALLFMPKRKPSLKKEFARAAKKTRKDLFKSKKRLRGTSGDIVSDGARVLADIRKELERFVNDARDDLRSVVNDEMKTLEKGLTKRKSRLFG
jgi:gas vesicle protein